MVPPTPTVMNIPPELKKITQFVRRAEELDKDSRPQSRIVSYYCRQHAVTIGIGLSKSAAATECLGDILTVLETERVVMTDFTAEESRHICRSFAMEVFDQADAEDRSGKSNRGTAKTFYAAAVFLEVLQHFDKDDNDEDVTRKEQKSDEKSKRIYSKWKATEILKALKEGREVVPGGYEAPTATATADTTSPAAAAAAEEEEEETKDNNVPPPPPSEIPSTEEFRMPLPPPAPVVENVDEDDDDDDDEPPPALPPPPPYNESDYANEPPPPPVPAVSAPAATSKPSSFPPSFRGKQKPKRVSADVLNDAIELTRFALAALENNDVSEGALKLEEALLRLSK